VTTLFAQIVAVELGADWAQVAVEPAPLSPAYADAVLAAHWAPLWLPTWLPILDDALGQPGNGLTALKAERGPMMLTVAGTGLAAFEQPLRVAAAALRAQLIDAAAAQWGVDAATLDTQDHAVIGGGKRLPFARLVEAALDRDPPADAPLRASPAREAPARFPAGSKPAFPRLDLPAKVDGSFVFAADVRLPGMVHAAIAHGPQGDCVLSSWDAQGAARVPGCLGVVHAKGWVAAIGVTWHAADRAVAAMEPRFRARGPVADGNAIDAALDKALQQGKAQRLWGQGDPTALLEKPSLTARYDIATALHAPLEPATCTARIEHGRLELWLATQAPEAARREGARVAGLAEADVVVYPMAAGGSFDARLDARIAGEAAALARATGKPVQLTWSRWQESLASLPRAPVSALLEAGMSPDKQQVLGWRSRIATPASLRETAARVLDGEGAERAPLAGQCRSAGAGRRAAALHDSRMRGGACAGGAAPGDGAHAWRRRGDQRVPDRKLHRRMRPLRWQRAAGVPHGHAGWPAAPGRLPARRGAPGDVGRRGRCLWPGDRLPHHGAGRARGAARGPYRGGGHGAAGRWCDPRGNPERLRRYRAGDQHRSCPPADRGRVDLRPGPGRGRQHRLCRRAPWRDISASWACRCWPNAPRSRLCLSTATPSRSTPANWGGGGGAGHRQCAPFRNRSASAPASPLVRRRLMTAAAPPHSCPAHLPADHPPVATGRIGVLLVNLGTPDAPDVGAVRRYLQEFLSDKRVVEIPALLWQPILRGIILRTRPKKSAHAYAQVWGPEGSPLAAITAAQARALQARLGEQVIVRHAMRYQSPAMARELDALLEAGCERILVAPLYPHYSGATTASALDAVADWIKQRRRLPACARCRPIMTTPWPLPRCMPTWRARSTRSISCPKCCC
jgi:hypothetical protein